MIGAKIVTGTVTAEHATPILTINLLADEKFSHTGSYICTANVIAEHTSNNYYPVISYTSGSQFVMRFHTTIEARNSVGFICVGN